MGWGTAGGRAVRGGGLTANVDFLHGLVTGSSSTPGWWAGRGCLLLQAVEAAGPRQTLVIWKAGRVRGARKEERIESPPRAPRSGQPTGARGGTAPTERWESPRNNPHTCTPTHPLEFHPPSVTRTMPCVPAIPPSDGRLGMAQWPGEHPGGSAVTHLLWASPT